MIFEKIHNNTVGEDLLFAEHQSGLKVYILQKKGFNKYYAIFGTRYGSIDNQFIIPGETEVTSVPDGIAHFLEHKLFEEEDGGNIFDKFSSVGANANAFTSFNMTAYLFQCTDNFYPALELLLGFVKRPYFTDENVAKEQGIIAQEIKMYEDDASWRVFFNALEGLYKKHSVKNDIAGTVESISKITPSILYKCYNTFYNASNMILFMTGDIDEISAGQIVDKYINDIKTEVEIKRIFDREPKEINKKTVKQNLEVSSPIFQIAFKDRETGITGRELLKKTLVTQIIQEVMLGKSSELYLELYESGLIDASFAKDATIEESYGFAAFGGESEKPDLVYQKIIDYINKHSDAGFEEEHINRIRKKLYGKFVKKFNQIEGISIDFMQNLFNGINIFDTLPILDEITQKDVNERFKTLFDPHYSTVSIVEPF